VSVSTHARQGVTIERLFLVSEGKISVGFVPWTSSYKELEVILLEGEVFVGRHNDQ
jgi:hypothetical protein